MSHMLRNKVQRKFRMRGYTLQVEALTEVLSFVTQYPDNENEAIDLLLDNLQFLSLKSAILDKETVAKVVSDLLEAAAAGDENPNTPIGFGGSALRIINVFDVPKYRYDKTKKTFYEYAGRLPLHGDSSAKINVYRDRFLLLSQRLSRQPEFSKPAFDFDISEYRTCEISPIQSLVGRLGRTWIMGLISQLEDGHFYLEDLNAAVEIDFSDAKITTGFFVENSVVVAEGEMLPNGVFKAETCGFPPLEDREKSVTFCAGLDFFGGGTFTKEETLLLQEMETRAVKDMFVILSDVWLDNEETMGNLETVFNGFENVDVVPSLFVFMGNFCSHPCNLAFNSYSDLRSQFGKLGQMIASHQRLMEHCRFLFIPGPDDVGPSTALPRCPLPKYITEELQKHVPTAIFSSNPCRVKFYTQEIVFFRQDLLYRMRRSCLIPYLKEEASDPFQHLVDTIIHQSHLCPLPLSLQPIIWNYDHCLHLYPTPHTIVLGDKSEQRVHTYKGVTCLNPGSFSNDSTFVAYRPCTREVELSNL
ncbi:hypothetical protein M9H77_14347 [Catharanthus roseus]|uniref:Uncharacterized protein n=1 Tax=Catharanthus roseus TaxID=4058 RepID=A0ACC0BMZ2_CATRO|nr:hypothetical protein M9H77_14347 [Catharanthus roseus]